VHPSNLTGRHVYECTFLDPNQLKVFEQLARVRLVSSGVGATSLLPVKSGDRDATFERNSISSRRHKNHVGPRSEKWYLGNENRM